MRTSDLPEALRELRRLARNARRRTQRQPDAAPVIARAIADCRTIAVETRDGGVAFRLAMPGSMEGVGNFTCVWHDSAQAAPLTGSERAVADQLCEGRTLAQIAHLRGVTINTIKSQVRQIFRKLDVESRVALVRRLCP
jgi:DNA-binding CsgD family transcriptional regulator